MKAELFYLELDNRWELEELSRTSSAYTQLYSFFYSILPNTYENNEIRILYAHLPWRGGYSTVNFFYSVHKLIPSTHRPQIQRIHYASPGFIELAGVISVASLVAFAVSKVSTALTTANQTYRQIQQGIRDNRLNQLKANIEELQLTTQQAAYTEKACRQLIQTLGINPEQDQILEVRTKGNKVMKLKFLMSVYRRTEKLAEKQAEGKLKVRNPAP
jgi:hypothetical protein